MEKIERIYALLTEAKPIEEIRSQKKILEHLSLQTIECSRFIVRYADDESFCKSDTHFAIHTL